LRQIKADPATGVCKLMVSVRNPYANNYIKHEKTNAQANIEFSSYISNKSPVGGSQCPAGKLAFPVK
jgi:hypothetical protein